MAKHFKLRISKAVSSFHSSCRSKDPSTLPQDPVPSLTLFDQSPPSIIPTTTNPHCDHHQPPPSSFKRHVSTALETIGCRCAARAGDAYTSNRSHTRSHSQEFKWKKEEKWHVVKVQNDKEPCRKISYSSVSGDSDVNEVLALPPPQKNKRRVRKKKTKTRVKLSSDESSVAWSEANEEDETETLVSSCRSCLDYSTDDSSFDLNQQLETICETNTTLRRHKKNGRSKRRVKNSSNRRVPRGINIGTTSESDTFRFSGVKSVSATSSDSELPPRLSVFKKLIPCSVDGKVKESFAIVKKSEDPYEDFKRSMMEMIYEKQMFEKDDLEQLLQCFLSLNAKNYHGMIVEAFSEIWKTLFSLNDH